MPTTTTLLLLLYFINFILFIVSAISTYPNFNETNSDAIAHKKEQRPDPTTTDISDSTTNGINITGCQLRNPDGTDAINENSDLCSSNFTSSITDRIYCYRADLLCNNIGVREYCKKEGMRMINFGGLNNSIASKEATLIMQKKSTKQLKISTVLTEYELYSDDSKFVDQDTVEVPPLSTGCSNITARPDLRCIKLTYPNDEGCASQTNCSDFQFDVICLKKPAAITTKTATAPTKATTPTTKSSAAVTATIPIVNPADVSLTTQSQPSSVPTNAVGNETPQSSTSPPIIADPSSNDDTQTETLGLAIGCATVIVSILVILVVALVLAFVWRRKKRRQLKLDSMVSPMGRTKRIASKIITDMLADTTQTVRVFECVKYVTGREEECDSIKRLLVDFTRASGEHEAEISRLVKQGKAGFLKGQRYSDVPILKQTALPDVNDEPVNPVRKELVASLGSGAPAIGGNYIDDLNSEKRYIMTEAPKPENMQAFLRCLVRDNVKVVVTIGTDADILRDRIYPYFRPGADCGEGDLHLDHTNEPLLQNSVIEVRAMVVTSESRAIKDHEFHHLLYKDWQDHSVANDHKHIAYIKSFTDRYLVEYSVDGAKLLTHCSAGVGRSGTLLAAFLCIDVVKEGHTEINIPAIVKHLRNYRLGTVRRKDQFDTLFKVVGAESESNKRLHLDVLKQVEQKSKSQPLQVFKEVPASNESRTPSKDKKDRKKSMDPETDKGFSFIVSKRKRKKRKQQKYATPDANSRDAV